MNKQSDDWRKNEFLTAIVVCVLLYSKLKLNRRIVRLCLVSLNLYHRVLNVGFQNIQH